MQMRIAVFGHKHVGTREGGVEVAVDELYRRIGQNHEVVIYDRNELFGEKKDTVTDDIPYTVKRVPTFKNGTVSSIIYAFLATLFCLFGKYDIIHIHTEGPCMFSPLLKRRNTVVTVHSLEWKTAGLSGFTQWYMKLGERMLVQHADEVIVLSEETRTYFKQQYNRDTVCVPNGVSIQESQSTTEIAAMGLEPNEYFLYVGRVSPEKRVDLLVSAYMASWRQEKLVIVGPMPDELDESLEFASKQPSIIFTGFLAGEKLNQLYTYAKLFILPSDLEGQSIALLEALAHGIPCIVSDIPENVRTVEKFGYLFKAGNLKELTEMLKDDSLTIMHDSIAQQKYILENHDWNDIVTITEGLYAGIIKKNEEDDGKEDEDDEDDEEEEKSKRNVKTSKKQSPLNAVKGLKGMVKKKK